MLSRSLPVHPLNPGEDYNPLEKVHPGGLLMCSVAEVYLLKGLLDVELMCDCWLFLQFVNWAINMQPPSILKHQK